MKIVEREEKRKVYDHYDEKMEKFVINRTDKIKKKIPETKKEIELYERVFNLLLLIYSILERNKIQKGHRRFY